jgi:hypothetical protein
MTAKEALDLYFLDARSKLIDLAAFLDRVERSSGAPDFRLGALQRALREIDKPGADRARRVLEALSDPTTEPVARAPGKGAVGAWDAEGSKVAGPTSKGRTT